MKLDKIREDVRNIATVIDEAPQDLIEKRSSENDTPQNEAEFVVEHLEMSDNNNDISGE